jgi:ATP sulfurylase
MASLDGFWHLRCGASRAYICTHYGIIGKGHTHVGNWAVDYKCDEMFSHFPNDISCTVDKRLKKNGE